MFDPTEEEDDADKALFKGVRASKFRHVYGSSARKDQCYENINITKNAHDSNFCAVNPKFLAIVTESCGGGSFIVIPIDKIGRVDIHAGRVTGHKGAVTDIRFNPSDDNVIASCSDDTTVKLWYIPDEGLQSRHLNQPIVDLREHTRRVSFVEWHPTADSILLSVGMDHMVMVWNTARAELVLKIDQHPDVIHSLSFNRDGSLFATTCKDKRLRIINPRSGQVVNEGLCHHGTKASKCVYLDDQRIFTVGFSRYSDRQWAVWSEKDLNKPLSIEIIDSSSGILFPVYDFDTKMIFIYGKGDGNIRFYEDQSGSVYYLGQYLSGMPQRGMGFMPKRGCDVYKCEIFRFYKLHATRGLCEPISMIVPRKSEHFQADIYPDTAAPTPALTAEQWLSGENRNPILFNLKTGAGAKTNKQAFMKTLPPITNSLKPLSSEYNAKLEYILQANSIDYREKAQPETGKSGGQQNGQQNGHTGKSSGYSNGNSNGQTNGATTESNKSSLLNTFQEAVGKKSVSSGRRRLPWVKDDEESGEEKPNPRCDIVSTKHLPAASFVTIADDSDDSLAGNTTDDSINGEMNELSSVNYGSATEVDAHHSPISDSLTDKTASTSDLIEAQLSSNPKNERELWTAFHEQRALIHKLRADLKEKSQRVEQLEELIAAANLDEIQ